MPSHQTGIATALNSAALFEASLQTLTFIARPLPLATRPAQALEPAFKS